MTQESYTVISKANCPWCDKAEDLIVENQGSVNVVSLEEEPWLLPLLKGANIRTVPQIITPAGTILNGYEVLVEYFKGLYHV
jgi:glutaredoxin